MEYNIVFVEFGQVFHKQEQWNIFLISLCDTYSSNNHYNA